MRFIMRLFRTRGERRRQDIFTLLSGHPDHDYRTAEISRVLGERASVVGPDLLTMHRRGEIIRRRSSDGIFYYKLNPAKKKVSA